MIIPLGLGAIQLGELGAVCGADIPLSLAHQEISTLVTSSREIEHGDLFCALRGKDDGHRYIAEAAKRGAVAVLAERLTEAPIPHMIVPSVREALGAWAAASARKQGLLRIGVTGSVGKTTVKDALHATLSPFLSVHATYQNHNNDLGLPFTILSAPKETRACICEIGINHTGEMAPLSKILSPHISIITCIGHAHIGAFGTREGIAKEKIDILTHAVDGGLLLVPATEPLLAFIPPRSIRRQAIFPFSDDDFRKYGIPPQKNDVPRSFAFAYAAAVGTALGLSERELALGLSQILRLTSRRKEESVGTMCFIDDGYNASPESMMAALIYLSEKTDGRRVCVLGDMLELGEESSKYHHAMGRFAARHSDLLFFFGEFSEAYAAGATAAGAKELRGALTDAPQFCVLKGARGDLGATISSCLRPKDTVLFKASRALRIEEIISEIKKYFS